MVRWLDSYYLDFPGAFFRGFRSLGPRFRVHKFNGTLADAARLARLFAGFGADYTAVSLYTYTIVILPLRATTLIYHTTT